ncbi:MAG: hypothetical protein ACRDRL_09450, partial [Sciscionella sp.]
MLGSTWAVSSAGAAQVQGFPPLHLPSLAQIRGWFEDPHWGPLPRQDSGSAAGHGHQASTASTRARGGAGHAAGSGNGQLPPYKQLTRKAKSGLSAGAQHGFDAKTSTRDAAKSTATSDYYRNVDGTFTRRFSQQPLNYRDAHGNWQPIDATLVRSSSGRWSQKANSLSVSFAGSSTDSALATVGFAPGESLSYGLSGAMPSTPSVKGSTITYAGVGAGTDLELRPTAAGLRESVVLHSAAAANTWTFPLDLKGLTAGQGADGSIQLTDGSGKSVGSIPAGYAYDSKIDPASGERGDTHAVTYRLQDVGGRQQLVVMLDPAWLHDPARVF